MMNHEHFIIGIAILCVFLSGAVILTNYHRTKRTMDFLENMLDQALLGDFKEENFDERRLSALETKFAHYFSASALSARNVAEEKDKIKTLISDISHQTKTPLSNLLLYADLLEEEGLPESAKSSLSALKGQTEKLRFLIDSLVKLSRLENGILTLAPYNEELYPVLQSVFYQYEEKARNKGLNLILEKTDCTALFDPKWTAEALCNLVDNAIKYTKQGSVAIRTIPYEMFIRIDIEDTGEGISEEEHPKIFSRFYRSSSVKNKEGVGIGLYLAREIIREENGYIKLASTPGKGSVFSVFLPVGNSKKQQQII